MFSNDTYQQHNFGGTLTKHTVFSNVARRILNIISTDFSYKNMYISDNADNECATAEMIRLQKHHRGESDTNFFEKSFG